MLADAIREERLLARMALLLAGLAAVLAAVGLYAVVAYSVAQRRREMGIRMALGARVATILGVVGKDAALLVGAGVVAGLSGAAVLSKLLESRLFGVERLDPLIYLAAGTLFATAAAVALWGPLRIAAKVSPAEALRQE